MSIFYNKKYLNKRFSQSSQSLEKSGVSTPLLYFADLYWARL